MSGRHPPAKDDRRHRTLDGGRLLLQPRSVAAQQPRPKITPGSHQCDAYAPVDQRGQGFGAEHVDDHRPRAHAGGTYVPVCVGKGTPGAPPNFDTSYPEIDVQPEQPCQLGWACQISALGLSTLCCLVLQS